jgi:AmiR/NasT family two-component response regulator
MNGIDAAAIIQKRQRMPIVFVTANSDESTLSRAKNTRPLGCIIKPFDGRELGSTIEAALSSWEAGKY